MLRWAAVVLLLLVAAAWFATRPPQLRRIVAAVVESGTGLEVDLATARLGWGGDLTLGGVAVRLPRAPGPDGRLFDAAQVMIQPDLSGVWRGRVALRSVVLSRPTLHLTEDLSSGRFNLQRIPRRGGGGGEFPEALPEVFVRNGAIRFGEIDAGGFREVGVLPLEGTLTEAADRRGQYGFELRQDGGVDGLLPALRGSVRLEPFAAHATLAHLGINAPQRNLLPRRVRDWWDRLSPEGSLPTVEVAYDADPGVGLHAVVVLQDGAITLPYGEFTPRMTDVSGRFVVRDEAIAIEDLSGQVQGIRYDIDGTIRGFEKDAPFAITAATAPFVIEENPGYVELLPAKVRKHYERFSPSGRFAIEAETRRDEHGGPVHYSGRVDVLNAKGAYYKFPYPLQDVKGEVRFSDQQVRIVELRGRGPAGGEVAISGTITPPGNGAAVEMTITADDVPVNDTLRDAMEPKHREVLDLFLNREAYASLVEQGVVRPSADAAGDAPVFTLGGSIDAKVRVSRPLGDKVKYASTVTIDTTGAGMLFEHWPYPLVSVGGSVTIAPDAVLVREVQARGLTGGAAIVDGRVDRPDKGTLVPNVTVREVRLPIDDLLLASLPAPKDRWARGLGLSGGLAGEARVFKAGEDIDFAFVGSLAEATAAPLGSLPSFSGFTGAFTLGRNRLTLDNLAATGADGSRVRASGEIGWSEGQLAANLRAGATDAAISRALVDLVPVEGGARDRVAQLFDAHRPDGRFNAELDFHTLSGGDEAPGGGDFTLTLLPGSLAFDYRGRRIAFEEMAGAVVVRPDGVELNRIAAAYDGGRASVSGKVPLDRAAAPVLRINAEGTGFDDRARALLPVGVVDTIDGLELRGAYKMTASLVTRRDAEGESLRVFDALVGLKGASASVGVPIRDLDGTLQIAAIKRDSDHYPKLDLRLEADRLRVVDRLVAPLSLHMHTGERPDELVMSEMVGEIYGGVLVGKGRVELAAAGKVQFDFSLQDVDVQPTIEPLPEEASDSAAEPEGGGKLNASLAIEAVPGQPETRRGRGMLEVRDAALYNNPLPMAMLQAASLSLPTHSSFDRASAQYLLDGDDVRFDLIRFESPTVAIIGSGNLDYATMQLDLNMVTRNPVAPSLGPIGDVLNVFKDELIAIHVSGPLERPEAKLVSFETIRQSVANVLRSAETAAAEAVAGDR